MTSMWVVQRDDGRYLKWDAGENRYAFMSFLSGQTFTKDIAKEKAAIYGGHLVELAPVKPKVLVSSKEANMLGTAHEDYISHPAGYILDYVNVNSDYNENIRANEDRLMRAYVDGYEVTEPTKYNVKVPHTTDGYYSKRSDTDGLATWNKADSELLTRGFTQFTEAEIEHYGLEDCERVEIDTEDSND